jgi:hypothetical protein
MDNNVAYTQRPSGLIIPNSVSQQVAPSDDFRNVEIFARNGFVIFRRPNATGEQIVERQTNVQGATTRLKAMIGYLSACKEHAKTSSVMRDKLPAIENFILQLEKVIEEAKEQGPFEYADMRRHRVRSAPLTLSMVTNND